MATLEARFKEAAENIRVGKVSDAVKAFDQSQKLRVYALFKQATVGDAKDADQPWAVQLEARAKWDAHKAVAGMSADQAMEEYIKLVTA